LAAISLIRLSANPAGCRSNPRCGSNPGTSCLRRTGGSPVSPARPCTPRGLSLRRLPGTGVGSYPTVSPLPHITEATQGGLFSVTLSVGLGSPPNRPRLPGAEYPVVSGLSSPNPVSRVRSDCPGSIHHPIQKVTVRNPGPEGLSWEQLFSFFGLTSKAQQDPDQRSLVARPGGYTRPVLPIFYSPVGYTGHPIPIKGNEPGSAHPLATEIPTPMGPLSVDSARVHQPAYPRPFVPTRVNLNMPT